MPARFRVQRNVAQPTPIITEAEETPQPVPEARRGATRPAGLRLALLSGVLLWMASPPLSLWPLAWVALAPLLVSITRATRLRQAIWRGYLFGWAFLGPLWYWIGLTIVGWTGGSPIGWLAWFGLTLLLAGFQAAWSGAAWWLARRTQGVWRLIGFAASWTVMEWGRTLGSLSMPWVQLSYTQYRFLPVLQFAEFTGAYGVSFLLMLVNAAIACWWLDRANPDGVRRLRTTLTLAAVCCLYGFLRLQNHDAGRPITVAAMQNGIDSFHVPSAATQLEIIEDQTALAARHDPPPALYVWAESAVPGDFLHDGSTHAMLRNLARSHQAAISTGGRISEHHGAEEYNASLLFPPNGARADRYDKQRLVPFGEFIPLRDLLAPLVGNTFDFPESDVQPGVRPHVLRYKDPVLGAVALGPFICYEAIFPSCARQMTADGATLLITQSNDSWFQSTAAMEQHLAAVTLRAIENRRELARATTTGITCLIDAEGRVLGQAPLFRAGYTVSTLMRMNGLTLYTRLGDWFVALSVLLILASLRYGRGRDLEA